MGGSSIQFTLYPLPNCSMNRRLHFVPLSTAIISKVRRQLFIYNCGVFFQVFENIMLLILGRSCNYPRRVCGPCGSDGTWEKNDIYDLKFRSSTELKHYFEVTWGAIKAKLGSAFICWNRDIKMSPSVDFIITVSDTICQSYPLIALLYSCEKKVPNRLMINETWALSPSADDCVKHQDSHCHESIEINNSIEIMTSHKMR